MKINKKLYSVALVSVTLVLYLTIVSSTALADTEQTASSAGAYAYITNYDDQTVSVIDTVTNTVTDTVPVGRDPYGIAVSPDGTKAYVTNQAINTVSIIDIPTKKVTSQVKVGNYPWKWDFGDGATSTEQNPKHTYTVAGSYTVSLTVTDAFGKDTIEESDYITVNPGPDPSIPVAAFSASPVSGDKPLKVKFTDTSTGNPTS